MGISSWGTASDSVVLGLLASACWSMTMRTEWSSWPWQRLPSRVENDWERTQRCFLIAGKSLAAVPILFGKREGEWAAGVSESLLKSSGELACRAMEPTDPPGDKVSAEENGKGDGEACVRWFPGRTVGLNMSALSPALWLYVRTTNVP